MLMLGNRRHWLTFLAILCGVALIYTILSWNEQRQQEETAFQLKALEITAESAAMDDVVKANWQNYTVEEQQSINDLLPLFKALDAKWWAKFNSLDSKQKWLLLNERVARQKPISDHFGGHLADELKALNAMLEHLTS